MAYVVNRGTRNDPKWYARYRDTDGKWKQRATGQPSKAAALAWARAVEARVSKGLVGVPEPTPAEQAARALTVAELAQRFLDEYSRPSQIKDLRAYRRAAGADLRQMIVHFEGYPLGGMRAMDVKRLDVERWRDALAAACYSPGSVNRGLGRLSRVYAWAQEQEIIPGHNPARGVEGMRDTPSEEVFTLDEVRALLSLPELPAMVWCAIYTGMRKGELYGLTWPAVRLDGDLPRIEVRRSYRGATKTSKPRTVPIHPALLPVLRSWREKCPATPDHLVFPVQGAEGWRMGFTDDMGDLPRLLRAAGCHQPTERPGRKKTPADRCWHTLRHTFASLFMEMSGDGYALSLILGHSMPGGGMAQMTAGYTHARLAYLQRELSKLDILPAAPAGVASLDEARRQRAAQA